jgi:hypothetical protein
MPIATVCPECASRVNTEVRAGLFTSFCVACSWQASGTVSYQWSEMPRSTSFGVAVLLSQAGVSAAALRELRSLSAGAGALPIQNLTQQLSSGVPFQVGVYPSLRAQEVAQRLEGVGFRVLVTKQNAG